MRTTKQENMMSQNEVTKIEMSTAADGQVDLLISADASQFPSFFRHFYRQNRCFRCPKITKDCHFWQPLYRKNKCLQ